MICAQVTRYPWVVDPLFASEHTNRYSDVSFKYGFVEGADNSGTLRWKVHGSRFYARNSIKGRAFLAKRVPARAQALAVELAPELGRPFSFLGMRHRSCLSSMLLCPER